jgi:hypothetical protein
MCVALVARRKDEFNPRLRAVVFGFMWAERSVFLFEARVGNIEGLVAAFRAFGDEFSGRKMNVGVAILATVIGCFPGDLAGFLAHGASGCVRVVNAA